MLPQRLTRIFHQFLLRRRKLLCGLRYVSAGDPQRVRNTPPVTSCTCLATNQLVPSRDKTGEISGLIVRLSLLGCCEEQHICPDSEEESWNKLKGTGGFTDVAYAQLPGPEFHQLLRCLVTKLVHLPA